MPCFFWKLNVSLTTVLKEEEEKEEKVEEERRTTKEQEFLARWCISHVV